jgi:hypothetical protein
MWQLVAPLDALFRRLRMYQADATLMKTADRWNRTIDQAHMLTLRGQELTFDLAEMCHSMIVHGIRSLSKVLDTMPSLST